MNRMDFRMEIGKVLELLLYGQGSHTEQGDIEFNSFDYFKIQKPTSGFTNWRDNSLKNFVSRNNETASNNSFNLNLKTKQTISLE